MLLLFETPAGYSLFKVKDEKKLDDAEVRVCVSRARGSRGSRWGVGAMWARAYRAGGIGVKARSGDGCGDDASWRARGVGVCSVLRAWTDG